MDLTGSLNFQELRLENIRLNTMIEDCSREWEIMHNCWIRWTMNISYRSSGYTLLVIQGFGVSIAACMAAATADRPVFHKFRHFLNERKHNPQTMAKKKLDFSKPIPARPGMGKTQSAPHSTRRAEAVTKCKLL